MEPEQFDPDDDEEDDEIEAMLDPIGFCRQCGSEDCFGQCFALLGLS